MLAIRLLGEIEVWRDGSIQPLPPSRKTRALLAYLALTGRPHRRERLCSLFWEIPHDPRGALRWSLSRLRPLVDEPDQPRIKADRDLVGFAACDAEIDVLTVRRALASGVESLSTDRLEDLARRFRGELLEGQDLPDLHDFQGWCVAEREDARRLQAQLLATLVERLETAPEAALPHARTLVQIDPYAPGPRLRLLRLLIGAGRRLEAEQQFETGLLTLREAAVDTAELAAEWRRLQPRTVSAAGPAPVAAPAHPLVEPSATLVGRDAERALLREACRSAAAGAARVALLTGEPGLGKTSLINELIAAAELHGGTTLVGHAYEADRDRPFGPWQEAMARLDGGFPGGGETELQTQKGAELGRYDDRRLARDRLYAAVIERLADAARANPPLVLIFEDIHWLDEASAALLAQTVRALRTSALFVLLSARDGELPDNAPILALLRGFRHDRQLAEIVLGPLSPTETAELAARIAPGVDAARVAAESGGNPLFAQELAQALGAGTEGVPRTLQALIRDRIERLPSLAVEILQTAAVLGPSFHIDLLERLLHLDGLAVVDALETLERHALLQPGAGPGTFAFRHELIHRAVYTGLFEPRRRLMHLKVAQLMHAQEPLDEANALLLAHHAAMAGDDRLAAEACVSAGRRCLRLLAGTEADLLARRGRRHAEALKEPDRTALLIDCLRIQLAASPPASPTEMAAEIEALGQRAADHGLIEQARRAYHMLSHIRWEQGRWSEAERDSLRGELLTRASDDQARVLALAEAARCLTLLERDPGHAEAFVLEAQALARRQGQEPDAVHDTLGMLRLQQGALDEAALHFERAREAARRDGERASEFMALEHLTKLEIRRGNCPRARLLAAELESLAERLRSGSELPFARVVAALCRQAAGEPGAEAELASALDALVAADAKHRLAFALNEAAGCDLKGGRHALAGTRAAEALRLATLLALPTEAAIARARLTELAARCGDVAALALHGEALEALLGQNISAHAKKLAAAALRLVQAPAAV